MFNEMNTISELDIADTLKSFIEENDTMFSGVWIDYLYDFVSELTGISQDTLNEYVNKWKRSFMEVRMNKKELIQAWRTIYAILKELGYDKLYEEEIMIVATQLRKDVGIE